MLAQMPTSIDWSKLQATRWVIPQRAVRHSHVPATRAKS
jgi:hypothetical protein